MDHDSLVKTQLRHLLYGVVIFFAIGLVAVLLDLIASNLGIVGVSSFTSSTLRFTAHAMLVIDLVLFFLYLLAAAVHLVRECSNDRL